MKKHRPKNRIGPIICKLRNDAGWTQDELVAKLQLCGWDCTRLRLEKIEAQEVQVRDFEVMYFDHVFGKALRELFRPSLLESPLPSPRKTKKPRVPPKARPMT